MIFKNRIEAGEQLAEILIKFQPENPVILALPRGGVAVAHPIAKALGCPLHILVVRKLGAPQNPELGIGAMTEEHLCLNQSLIDQLEINSDTLLRIIQKERKELERRLARYSAGDTLKHLENRTVILIDDGLATGITAQVALENILQKQPKKLVLAVPVGATETLHKLQRLAHEIICLNPQHNLDSVGEFYQDFPQLNDETVLAYLALSPH